VNIRRTIFAISLSLLPPLIPSAASAAADCQPRLLHSVPLVTLRDSRSALPVTFGATPGVLIIDSAAVAQPPIDASRKSVPITGSNVEDFTAARTNYAGIAGSLTPKTVQALGLTANETGVRFSGAASGRREMKVSVQDFAIHGLSPFATEFLVSDGDSRVADYAGTFAINNFTALSFDLDLDFAARTARMFARDCAGPPGDWTKSPVAKVKFKIDGNGFITLPVMLDGKEVAAVLDTGSVPTTIDFGFASRNFRFKENDPSLTQVTQMDDGRAVYTRPFRTVGFEGISVANPQLLLVSGIRGRSEGAPTGSRVDRDKRGTIPPLVLGMSVLRHLRVYLAFGERVLYFAPSAAAVVTPAAKP
jgi:hypothetical protein